MNKLKTFAAILKFINGSNNSPDSLRAVCDYTTDKAKTDGGKLMATQGCSLEHAVEDMLANKRLHNKTHGKQYEHFVLAPCPNGSDKSPQDILRATKEIVATLYPEYMAIISVHTDTKVTHAHTILDAVNAITGRKFSQSPSDLNRVKQGANGILKKHGFEIITASANDIVDHTDYSKEEGFNFLEIDESQFITEDTVEEISTFTDSVSLTNTNLISGWGYPSCDTNNYCGGSIMNQNYIPFMPRTQSIPAAVSTPQQIQEPPVFAPTVEVIPSTAPASTMMPQEQEQAVPAAAVETVPAAIETAGNIYPTTSVITGLTVRIKGTPGSNLAGLKELVNENVSYAQEHQREAANLALAMNQYTQQSGYPANVSVYAGPIFDIDMTGGIYPQLPENDDNK